MLTVIIFIINNTKIRKENMKTDRTNGYTGTERREHVDWHLNRSVSMTIIILLLGNIATSIWWASSINSDITALRDTPAIISVMKERLVKLETTVETHNKYFNKLNDTLEKFNTTIDRIDREQSRRTSIIKRVENHFDKKG